MLIFVLFPEKPRHPEDAGNREGERALRHGHAGRGGAQWRPLQARALPLYGSQRRHVHTSDRHRPLDLFTKSVQSACGQC